MRRLLLGLFAFAYLAFVGLEAAHTHAPASAEPCQVCVLGAQAVGHAPSAAPAPVQPITWTRLAAAQDSKPVVPARGDTAARSPPLA